MKSILVSTLALTIGTAAFAQSDMTEGEMDGAGVDLYNMDQAQLIRTRDITGGEIYTMNEANDEG